MEHDDLGSTQHTVMDFVARLRNRAAAAAAAIVVDVLGQYERCCHTKEKAWLYGI